MKWRYSEAMLGRSIAPQGMPSSAAAASAGAALSAGAENAGTSRSRRVASAAARTLLWAVLAALFIPHATLHAQDGTGRTYVRRIELEGVTRTDDRTLRRHLLQLEGTFLNTVALQESLRGLRRLPYVAGANASLRPVPGEADVVDVVIEIEEAPARRYGGGGGYSESQRTSVHGYYIDENLLGSGQRLAFTAEGSDLRSALEISHTRPDAGPAGGLARTIALSSLDIERLTTSASLVDAQLSSAVLEYEFPLASRRDSQTAAALGALASQNDDRRASRDGRRWSSAEVREPLAALRDLVGDLAGAACCQTIRLGLELRRAEIAPFGAVSEQLREWIESNGGASSGDRSSAQIDEVGFLVNWRHDTRDRSLFPRRGLEQRLGLSTALPGSDVEYYRADYELNAYRSFGHDWTLHTRARLGYGAAYGGDTTSLPPYLNWFAGGPSSVRGFDENTLGPRDSFGNPYGGNLLVAGQVELLTAWPPRFEERARVGFFVDVGNVFSTEDVPFTDASGGELDYGFDASSLRASVGVTAQVLLPLGALRLSYALPLNADDDHPNPFLRDDVERLQISIGVDFR